jgi:uncharacterized protein YbaR (Trm112 family)
MAQPQDQQEDIDIVSDEDFEIVTEEEAAAEANVVLPIEEQIPLLLDKCKLEIRKIDRDVGGEIKPEYIAIGRQDRSMSRGVDDTLEDALAALAKKLD